MICPVASATIIFRRNLRHRTNAIYIALTVCLMWTFVCGVHGESPPGRVVPPIDSQILTGPQEEAQRVEKEAAQKKRDAQVEAIRREAEQIEARIATAKQNGQETTHFESDLKAALDRLDAVNLMPAWEPSSAAYPVYRAKVAELYQLMKSESPISAAGAQQLVDALYCNIEPKLNCGVQGMALNYMAIAASDAPISNEARSLLREGVFEYWFLAKDQCDDRNIGAMCNPHSMTYLARVIAAVATPEDAEARELYETIKRRALARCDELQRDDWKQRVLRYFAISEDQMNLSSEDLRGIQELSDVPDAKLDIKKLLRSYRKVLRGPKRRVPPATIELIDRNLGILATRELDKSEWDLWADASIALGARRASAALKAMVAQRPEHEDSAKDTAMTKVNRVYKRIVGK